MASFWSGIWGVQMGVSEATAKQRLAELISQMSEREAEEYLRKIEKRRQITAD